MISKRIRRAVLAFAAVAALSAWPAAAVSARAQDVVAVLSSVSEPYEAVFESFQRNFGRPVNAVRLAGKAPAVGPGTRVIVAFGGAAALQRYPKSAAVIACVAPGIRLRSPHGGPYAFVGMKPAPEQLLVHLRELQPGLKRLAVLWDADITGRYMVDLKSAAAATGITILDVRIKRPEDVPDALRGLYGKADALWLAPDPRLVTPEIFQTIKQFSWDNGVPFYAPTTGLVAAGAAGAVSVGAEETGRQAAELARRALAGEELPQIVYSTMTEVAVNPASAAKAGLVIGPEVLKRADKVIQ